MKKIHKKRLTTTAIVINQSTQKLDRLKIVEILKAQSRVSPLYIRLVKNANVKKERKNMEKIIITENMIDSISSQISAKDIKQYINNNRIEYLRYLMNLIKNNTSINMNGGVIND